MVLSTFITKYVLISVIQLLTFFQIKENSLSDLENCRKLQNLILIEDNKLNYQA